MTKKDRARLLKPRKKLALPKLRGRKHDPRKGLETR